MRFKSDTKLYANGLVGGIAVDGRTCFIQPALRSVIFPFEEAGLGDQRLIDCGVSRHSGYLVRFIGITDAGFLTLLTQKDGIEWRIIHPAARLGEVEPKFRPGWECFGYSDNENLNIYAVTAGGRLMQLWSENGTWHKDFPAELAGQPNLRFSGSISVHQKTDNNTKVIAAITQDGRLAQLWDDDLWHLDFPCELAGYPELRFANTIDGFARFTDVSRKNFYLVTSDGRLAQVWDESEWKLDFPAELGGRSDLRFKPRVRVMKRSYGENLKDITLVSTDGDLCWLWDDDNWHVEAGIQRREAPEIAFPSAFAMGSPDFMWAIDETGRLVQLTADPAWHARFHISFPAEGLESPIALKAFDGQFVSARDTGGHPIFADRKERDRWETFYLVHIDGGRFAFRSVAFGTYICAENGGGEPLLANRREAKDWEAFEIRMVGPGRVSLRCANGQYVGAKGGGGGGGELVADRDQVGSQETFEMIKLTPAVVLRAANGQYVVADWGGGSSVSANRDSWDLWETFVLVHLADDQVALRTVVKGQFVCAENGGGGAVNANRNEIGPWETFRLVDLGSKQVAFQTTNGQYLCAESGGGKEVVANRDQIGPWETFLMVGVQVRLLA